MAGGCAGVIIFPWYLWQSWMHGSLFVQEYVGFNLIGRMSHTIEGHWEPPWFYLNILRRGFSIWGYLWPLAYLWAVRRAWQQGDRRLWLLLGWITVPLLVFSIAQTKLGWYIGIVYPAVALLLGLALTELLTERLAFGVVAAVMAVCCIRLPMALEGSPGMRPFAASVAQHVAPGETIYAFERICKPRGLSLPDTVPLQAGQNVQPALRFYLPHTLRLRCLEARDLEDGFFQPDAYIIVHQKLRPHVQPPGQVVLEADQYALLRWRR
jgi:hypothetical protein